MSPIVSYAADRERGRERRKNVPVCVSVDVPIPRGLWTISRAKSVQGATAMRASALEPGSRWVGCVDQHRPGAIGRPVRGRCSRPDRAWQSWPLSLGKTESHPHWIAIRKILVRREQQRTFWPNVSVGQRWLWLAAQPAVLRSPGGRCRTADSVTDETLR